MPNGGILLSLVSKHGLARRRKYCCLISLDETEENHKDNYAVHPTGLQLFEFYASRIYVDLNITVIKVKVILRQSVLVSGTHLGPATNFFLSLKFSLDSCGFVIL
jgi:hypothetical protein